MKSCLVTERHAVDGAEGFLKATRVKVKPHPSYLDVFLWIEQFNSKC